MSQNPDAPAPTPTERLAAQVGRSREVVIFALGMLAGAALFALGSLT